LSAARAEPAPKSATVCEWPIASVTDGITNTAKGGAGRSAGMPVICS